MRWRQAKRGQTAAWVAEEWSRRGTSAVVTVGQERRQRRVRSSARLEEKVSEKKTSRCCRWVWWEVRAARQRGRQRPLHFLFSLDIEGRAAALRSPSPLERQPQSRQEGREGRAGRAERLREGNALHSATRRGRRASRAQA